MGVVVACALALVACSSDGGTTEAKAPLTKADVRKALITADDFPDHDYTAGPAAPSGQVLDFFDDDSCDDEVAAMKSDLDAKASFVSAGGSVTLVHAVDSYPGQGQAVRDAFARFVNDCKLVRTASGQITVGPLALGALVDDTQSAQILVDNGGVFTETAVVLASNSDLTSVVVLQGQRPLNRTVLDSVVRDAIGKLGALAEGV
jgi:hypothetical protein